MEQETKALAATKHISEHRDERVKQLKDEGKKIVGYFCSYTPLEIITAAGFIPYRIVGDMHEPMTEVGAYLENLICPYIRNCFDLGFKGAFQFLDGVVMPHSCDMLEKSPRIWKYYLNPVWSINVPHLITEPTKEFFEADLTCFKEELEELAGKEITKEALCEAVRQHNENRALVRVLYGMRQQDPPKLSGAETLQVLLAAMSLPVTESNELLKGVIREVERRQNDIEKKPVRLLLYGGEIDDVGLVQMIEDCGANVVVDDSCFGTRHYWHDVEETIDPLKGISFRYLTKIMCPRTYREQSGYRTQEDLNRRFAHIESFASEYNVNGIIAYIIWMCDIHAFEFPDLRDYFGKLGLPVLYLESDYSWGSIMQLKTRIQAFVEMIQVKG